MLHIENSFFSYCKQIDLLTYWFFLREVKSWLNRGGDSHILMPRTLCRLCKETCMQEQHWSHNKHLPGSTQSTDNNKKCCWILHRCACIWGTWRKMVGGKLLHTSFVLTATSLRKTVIISPFYIIETKRQWILPNPWMIWNWNRDFKNSNSKWKAFSCGSQNIWYFLAIIFERRKWQVSVIPPLHFGDSHR